MKGNFLKALLFIPTAALLFQACNKDDKNLGPGDSNDSPLKAMYDGLKSTPQAFTVTAGTNQTITGAQGTVIHFHPGSFRDASGNTLSSGSVSIELTEMYKPGDMIANRVTTTTVAQKSLISGGSILLKASLNGQEVFTNGYSLAFRQPQESGQAMALFRGIPTTDATGTSIKWSDDTTNTVMRTVKSDSTDEHYYLFDTCTSFNWINCDYFYTAPDPKTDVRVVLPDASYDQANTNVFVVFPAINSVTMMYAFNSGTRAFSFGYPSYHLPVGTEVKIVVMGAKDNGYFMEVLPAVTITSGMTITANPTTRTLSEVQSMLSSL